MYALLGRAMEDLALQQWMCKNKVAMLVSNPALLWHTPLCPSNKARAKAAHSRPLEKSTSDRLLGSPLHCLLNIAFPTPVRSSCACRTGLSDVAPSPTNPGGSAGSVAASGKAREAACCGRQVATFRVLRRSRDFSRFQMLVGELCGHIGVGLASDRAPHIRERALAAWPVAARHGWSLAAVAKLRYLRFCRNGLGRAKASAE